MIVVKACFGLAIGKVMGYPSIPPCSVCLPFTLVILDTNLPGCRAGQRFSPAQGLQYPRPYKKAIDRYSQTLLCQMLGNLNGAHQPISPCYNARTMNNGPDKFFKYIIPATI